MTQPVRVPLPLTESVWDPARRILEVSFPEEEIGPVDEVRAQIQSGSRSLWVDDLNSVSALAVICPLKTDQNDVLLEFLAVEPALRSTGIGARLLAAVMRSVRGPLILEVEDPDAVKSSDALRRIAFYERLGGTLLACSGYAMPNLASESGTQPMRLIEMDKHRATELTGAELRKLVTAIWVGAYHQRYRDGDLLEVLASLSC